MPTYYVNTASTSGGNGTSNATTGVNRAYASVGEGFDARDSDTYTEDVVFLCCGSTVDATTDYQLRVMNWPNLSTHRVIVRGNPDEADGWHPGYWSTSHFRFEASSTQYQFRNRDMPVTFEGVQFHQTGTSATVQSVRCYTGSDTLINACVFNCPIAGNGVYVEPDGVLDISIRNSVFFHPDATTTSSEAIYSSSSTGVHTITIDNCVITGFDDGIETDGSNGTVTIRNCAVYDNDGNDFELGSTTNTVTYTASDDNPSGTGNFTPTEAWTDIFEDTTTYDYHLASGEDELTGGGVNLYATFQEDIDRDARQSAGAWDVGIDAVSGSGPTNTPWFFNNMILSRR